MGKDHKTKTGRKDWLRQQKKKRADEKRMVEGTPKRSKR